MSTLKQHETYGLRNQISKQDSSWYFFFQNGFLNHPASNSCCHCSALEDLISPSQICKNLTEIWVYFLLWKTVPHVPHSWNKLDYNWLPIPRPGLEYMWLASLPSTANRPSVDVILLAKFAPPPFNPGHHSIQKDIEFTLKDPSYHCQRGGKTGHCLKNCMCLSKSIVLFAMSPAATVKTMTLNLLLMKAIQ